MDLLPLLAPFALGLAAVLAHLDSSPRPRVALLATRSASAIALLVAALTGLAAFRGPRVSALVGADGLGFSVRIDGLSAVMLALVAALVAAVIQFSRNYLDGDRRQAVFLGDLALTGACVMLVVLSGNLVQLAVIWSATSLALHRLLLFYPERPGAVVAARKKFVVARAGDVCLVAASLLLLRTFGTGDIGVLAERARALAAGGEVPLAVHLAAGLIALTAALKAAQFPGHGWLTEMNETPTPVSALLHAGILNGGTFLVVRLAHVVQLSAPALWLLIVIGGFTALFSSVVMVTETRVKVALGHSSAAHMGFMLLLCGIGAYTVAIVHLVAHSFYKAHAFLSSGSAVDIARASVVPERDAKGSLGAMLVSLVAAAALVTGIGALLGFSVLGHPTSSTLAVVLTLGLMQLIAQAMRGGFRLAVVGRSALAAAATALSFFTLELGGAMILGRAIPQAAPPGPATLGLTLAVVTGFALVSVLQAASPNGLTSPFSSAAYVHVRNGLYANAYFDRLVGAAKLPSSASRASFAEQARSPFLPSSLASPEALHASVERVTHAHAPVWPLATFVAVNPYLGLSERPFAEAAETMARVAGARTTMPRPFYVEAIESGRIGREHLSVALAEAIAEGRSGLPTDVASLLASVRSGAEPFTPKPLPTVADVVGRLTSRNWSQVVAERVGAWAATYFDEGQASWPSPWRGQPAYAAWQAEASLDKTPEVLGARGFRGIVARLPQGAREAIEAAAERLAIPEAALDTYLQRLLASIGGWASYARQRVWNSELHGRTDGTLEQVLAVRLGWEVALLDAFAELGSAEAWAAARAAYTATAEYPPELALDLVLQSAYEKAWQEELIGKMPGARTAKKRRTRARVQAAFCIDVRSEVFRRAFETVDPECETFGVAGFFGFPIEYVPLGQQRGGAHCPVLLKTSATVVESVLGETDARTTQIAESRVLRRRAKNAWKSFKSGAIACFSFVGPVGLAYAPKLLSDTLGLTRPTPHPSRDGIGREVADRLGPQPTPRIHQGRPVGLSDKDRLAMAEGLLRAMSLTSGFARLVMLTGHGSTTVNNPHAAGLDCGACGGHTGEANARVAAAVLNEPAVRAGLAERGIVIPGQTVFLGCLHDTTTDEVRIFDRDAIPTTHAADLARLEATLAEAGVTSRRQRAPLLGEALDAAADARVLARSRDWSQVRPEWGLAGCAAFIVAPRHRTAGVDLGGRAFLHSYEWRADAGFGVLELVMTAPMVVGAWISLQYYASTVDNRVLGCGNKVLHNVVGTVGVLEGNGGDLRTGLPWQSVHDGRRLVHEPMRLNVLIEAPIDAMNAILAKHPSVRALVDNGWLHLYALGDAGQVTHRYGGGLTWQPVAPTTTELAA